MRASIHPILVALTFCAFLHPAARAKDPKLKPEELINKHLESIGSAQKKAEIQSRAVQGRARMKMESGESGPGAMGMLAGSLAMISAGGRLRIALPFNYADYWGEQFVFDGMKTEVDFAYIQKRSPVGDFLFRYDVILQEGLLGGVLSTAWPLLEITERKPKLEYAGTKKIGDMTARVLRYLRNKGQADLRISLFFDTKTFRHPQSLYTLALAYDTVSPALSESQPTSIRSNGTIVDPGRSTIAHNDSGRQGYQYRLAEFFSDFKAIDGVTLPGSWNIIFDGRATTKRYSANGR